MMRSNCTYVPKPAARIADLKPRLEQPYQKKKRLDMRKVGTGFMTQKQKVTLRERKKRHELFEDGT
jgi:hypothetical protein